MAKLYVRERGADYRANLPNVRQVDYSGIGNNALTRHQAHGGLGVDIQNAIRGIASGIGQTVEVLNARDEREATRKAAELQSALTKKKEQFLKDLQLDPSKADKAVETWESDVRAEQAKVAKELGGESSYRQECFKRSMEPFLDNSYVDVFRTSFKISEGYNQKVASAGLDMAFRNLVDSTDATQEKSMNALIEKFNASASANHWSEEERNLNFEKLLDEAGVARVNRAVATASSDKELGELYTALTSIGKEDANAESKKILHSVFGAIDPSTVSPEQLRKLTDNIATRRVRMRSVQREDQQEVVDTKHNEYLDGKMTYESMDEAINTLAKSGAPQGMLTKLYNDRKQLFTSHCISMAEDVAKQALTAIDEAVGSFDESAESFSKKAKDPSLYWESALKDVPKEVKENESFQKIIDSYKKIGREATEARISIETDERRYLYLEGEGALMMSANDRKTKLRELNALLPHYYTREQLSADLKTIDSMEKDNRKQLVLKVAGLMNGVVPNENLWGANSVFLSDLTSLYDEGDPMKGLPYLKQTFASVEEKDIRETWKQFHDGTTKWLKACDENPSWTDQQRAQLYYDTVVKFVLHRLGSDAKLRQSTQDWQNTLNKTFKWLDALQQEGMSRPGYDVPYTRYSNQSTLPPKAQKAVKNPS